MFKIGDFSRIARVSCRLLRYYDEIGLLKPAAIESDSGYRYYTAAQLPQLNRILVLKDLGLSLDEVAKVITEKLSADELRGMLLMRRREVERVLEAEAERLRHIESRIAQIETQGQLSADDVVIRLEPARHILSTREIVPSFVAARQLIGTVAKGVNGKVAKDLLGNLTALAHSPEFEPDHIDLELGFVLNGPLEHGIELADGRKLTVRELPAVERMATCVRIGLPEHAHLITAKIGQHVEQSGYQLAGPSREVFLQPPRPDRMHEAVVEMQYPIAPIGKPQAT
jgi:DNA-binding transcriptional MerR regulator